MTPTPPSTTPSSNGRSPDTQFRVVRKRNRVPLSCYPCRQRKLKCDRSHPCSNCMKREGSDGSACSYAAPTSRKKNQSQGEPTPDDMQNRIDRLEGLVLSLMHGGANIEVPAPSGTNNKATSDHAARNTPSTVDNSSSVTKADSQLEDTVLDGDESDIDDVANSLGVLKVDPTKSKHIYLGEEHWHTILLDIAEVKNYFASHKKELENSYEQVKRSKPSTAMAPPALLIGAIPATEVELRAELPPKSTVLTLCGRYFNSMDNAVNIIHAPTFHQQLRNHWQDPSKTPIMWLGLLYSILCLAMLSYHKVGDEPPEWKGRALELADEYRLRTVQCLIAGDYTKPAEYTVETMILYAFCEYSSRWDADLGLWLIISLVTRVALRMGYHRDGKWFPTTITPFQAEMRRRTWALVRTTDIFFSHQVSLSSMINENDCDTELPHNIFDEEFGPDTKVLPPSRPNSEPTPISYMIVKIRLCLELGNILQMTGRVKNQVHYDEILRYDSKLREIKAELPPHLKLQPLEGSHDPLTLIIARFNIDILYLKIMCLLHRKYLPRARHSPRYVHSRRSAIEASLETLRHLATLHRESQPNGRLQSIKWYVTSVATKDFLLPAMLIALDLHFDNEAQRSGERQSSHSLFFWTREQREEMIRSLEQTIEIWKGLVDISIEAVKASNVLDVMLAKIKSSVRPDNRGASPPEVVMRTDPFGPVDLEVSQPEHSAAMTLGMLSSGNPLSGNLASAFNTVQSPGGTTYSALDLGLKPDSLDTGAGAASDFANASLLDGAQSPLSMFNSMAHSGMDFGSNFDWDSFENFTQTANFGGETYTFFSGNADALQQQADGSLFYGNPDITGSS
ncbi:fungal-specific transcription factor domain-containing protein [Triangularia verruculosa]|uniref:Fungal-specific transcription factor domain-containing protein n=1 Tax=Triangularia verruculosa TaxID=2587418 RepID=A0AAN6XBM7_9PEZI|nr:fungal-specific transcription factor domain-containing protein [Triangularia verruculosa]